MRESEFQAKIIRQYEAAGWYVIKLIQTNKNGIPDLLLMKEGKAFFIEVKTKKGRLSALQAYRHKQLLEQGFEVKVIHESIKGRPGI